MILTAERAREVLSYNPETGELRWKVQLAPRGKVGAKAGYIDVVGRGRVHLRIDGKLHLGHRIAWLITYGAWPMLDIDHIDGNPANNRLGNLREATNQQNTWNQRKIRGGSSKLKGVSYDRARRLWCSQIGKDGKHYHLGRYASEEAAHAAYCEAASRLFGEFARFD